MPRRVTRLIAAPGLVTPHVGAAGRHLRFLERGEVVEERRRFERLRVADDDAVERVGVLIDAGAGCPRHHGLHSVAAGDVDAVEQHPGRLLEERPRIARARHLVELFARHVRTGRDPPLVEQRTLRGDRDGAARGRRQDDVDGGAAADVNGKLWILGGRVVGELHCGMVEPGLQREEAELADGVGVLRPRLALLAAHRHLGLGERRASVVAHHAVERPRRRLRERRRGDGHSAEEPQQRQRARESQQGPQDGA